MKWIFIFTVSFTIVAESFTTTHIGNPKLFKDLESETLCLVEIQRDVEYKGHVYAKYRGPVAITRFQKNAKSFGKPIIRISEIDISSLIQRLEVKRHTSSQELSLKYILHGKVISELIIKYNVLAQIESVFIRKDQIQPDTNEVLRYEAKCLIPVDA